MNIKREKYWNLPPTKNAVNAFKKSRLILYWHK